MQVPDESNDEELFDVFEKSALITKDYTVDIYYNSSTSEFADDYDDMKENDVSGF